MQGSCRRKRSAACGASAARDTTSRTLGAHSALRAWRLLRASPIPSARPLTPWTGKPFRIPRAPSRDVAPVAVHNAASALHTRYKTAFNPPRSESAVLGQRYCFIAAAIALACPPSGRGEHGGGSVNGAPNREPPEIRSGQTAESLCPVRGDDLPAGMVRVSGPAPRPASLGMRSVRLQVRDAGHVPRPIVCTVRTPSPREEPPAAFRWLCI